MQTTYQNSATKEKDHVRQLVHALHEQHEGNTICYTTEPKDHESIQTCRF